MIRPLAVLLATGALVAQNQFRPTSATTLPPLQGAWDVTSGDVDGDGDLDLVVGNDPGSNQLLLNDGRGRFTDATAGRLTSPSRNATREVDLVDVDGDGDLDLLCSANGLPNRVHRNNGGGVFVDVSATALPPNQFLSLDQVVLDFDGDGDVDWLVVDVGFTAFHLYLNNGAGVFSDASATHVPANAWGDGVSSFAADLDGDGDLDVGLSWRFTTQVLLNQGGARFVLAPAGYLRGTSGGHAWVGDVDGDGRPDVFLNQGRILLLNLGGGQFRDVSATALPGGNTVGTMFDADLDGDLDVIGPDQLWLNDGAGRFMFAAGRYPAGAWGHVPLLVADVDGDRDGDLVSAYGTFGQLSLNFLRQIDAASPARIGQRYTVDMYVRPGFAQNPAALVPALALGGSMTPLPPYGILRLDPGSIHVLGVYFVLPPVDTVQVSYVIPPDPNLVGLQLHHQALVVETSTAAALSNAIFDVIAN